MDAQLAAGKTPLLDAQAKQMIATTAKRALTEERSREMDVLRGDLKELDFGSTLVEEMRELFGAHAGARMEQGEDVVDVMMEAEQVESKGPTCRDDELMLDPDDLVGLGKLAAGDTGVVEDADADENLVTEGDAELGKAVEPEVTMQGALEAFMQLELFCHQTGHSDFKARLGPQVSAWMAETMREKKKHQVQSSLDSFFGGDADMGGGGEKIEQGGGGARVDGGGDRKSVV